MDLVEVFRHQHTAVAQLAKSVLADHGLHPVLQGENLASTVGIGSFTVPCRILVPAREVDEAALVLAIMDEEAKKKPEGGPERCPACEAEWEPGFQECWQCQEPIPATPDGL